MKAFTILKPIGKGGYSQVHLVCHNTTGKEYACKIITKSSDNPQLQRDRIINEINIMQRLNKYDTTIKLLDTFEDNDAYYLIQELAIGTLANNQIYDPIKTRNVIHKTLICLQDMHNENVVHMDIKPPNLFLKTNCITSIVLGDFGASVIYNQPDPTKQLMSVNIVSGTPHYMSPESLNYNISFKSDIWSIGITTYVLLTGQLPFKCSEEIPTRIWRNVFTSEPNLQIIKDPKAKEFIEACLHKEAIRRPTIEECLSSQFFQ